MKLSWSEVIVRVLIVAGVTAFTYLLITDDGYPEDYASFAVGVANSGKASLTETKLFNFGHRDKFLFGLSYQYEVGGWIDIAGQGRKGSGYGAYQIGVETDGPIFARVMVGPALITTPDAYLGGAFNFTEDFYLGLSGKNGNTIGVLYKHVSNAGLEPPNMGRDFAGVTVSIPF